MGHSLHGIPSPADAGFLNGGLSALSTERQIATPSFPLSPPLWPYHLPSFHYLGKEHSSNDTGDGPMTSHHEDWRPAAGAGISHVPMADPPLPAPPLLLQRGEPSTSTSTLRPSPTTLADGGLLNHAQLSRAAARSITLNSPCQQVPPLGRLPTKTPWARSTPATPWVTVPPPHTRPERRRVVPRHLAQDTEPHRKPRTSGS